MFEESRRIDVNIKDVMKLEIGKYYLDSYNLSIAVLVQLIEINWEKSELMFQVIHCADNFNFFSRMVYNQTFTILSFDEFSDPDTSNMYEYKFYKNDFKPIKLLSHDQ